MVLAGTDGGGGGEKVSMCKLPLSFMFVIWQIRDSQAAVENQQFLDTDGMRVTEE